MGQMAWEGDLLDRKPRADFLTKYLDGDACRVLNLDSPWGAGKTYFLKNWRHDLILSRPVVYFNAWEHDFLNDPLLSLVANIREQLTEYQDVRDVAGDQVRKFTKRAGELALAIAPAVAKGLVKKHLGEDVLDAIEKEDIADVSEKFVESVLEKNKEALEAVEDFRKALGDLFSRISKKYEDKPVYVFIDELDRCRPTYAIELLERVKHFFAIDGCRFVIATDTAQLAHSVSAVYGGGFAAKRYLKRFFDATFVLDNSKIEAWVIAHIKAELCPDLYTISPITNGNGGYRRHPMDEQFVRPSDDSQYPKNLTAHQVIFSLLAKTFDSQIRDMESIKKRLSVFGSYFGETGWDFFLGSYLTFLLDSEIQLPAVLGSIYANDGFWISLAEKYPSKGELYLGYGNYTVHEIAKVYFKVMSLDNRAIMDMAGQGQLDESVATPSLRQRDLYHKYVRVALLSGSLS